MSSRSNDLDLYSKLCAAATLIHETEFRLRGESYATPEEMDTIRQDPLAFDDQIQDMLILSTGYRTRHGSIEQASVADMVEAARSVHEGWRYIAARDERMGRS